MAQPEGSFAWEAQIAREEQAAPPRRPDHPLLAEVDDLRRDLAQLGREHPGEMEGRRGDLLGISRRLAHLESAVLRQMTVEHQLKPEWVPVLQRLASAGFPEEDALAVLSRAQEQCNAEEENIPELYRRMREIMGREVCMAPAEERVQPGLVVLIGGAGVGKTTLAAKLAAELRLNRNCTPILGVLHPRGEKGVGAIRFFAEAMDVPCTEVRNDRELQALGRQAGDRPVILDTPALNPLDAAALNGFRQRLAPAPLARVHAVVPASQHVTDLAVALQSFILAGATRLSMTKLDEAPYIGRVLAAASRSRMPIGYLSRGPRIPDDLEQPVLSALIHEVFQPAYRVAV